MFNGKRNQYTNMQPSTWEITEPSAKPVFDETFYNAYVAARRTADKYATDKTTRQAFKTIEAKLTCAPSDPRSQLTVNETALIRRWYLKSLEG